MFVSLSQHLGLISRLLIKYTKNRDKKKYIFHFHIIYFFYFLHRSMLGIRIRSVPFFPFCGQLITVGYFWAIFHPYERLLKIVGHYVSNAYWKLSFCCHSVCIHIFLLPLKYEMYPYNEHLCISTTLNATIHIIHHICMNVYFVHMYSQCNACNMRSKEIKNSFL